MSLWEADAPGVFGPWWVTRKSYFPDSVSTEFDNFVDALNQHNAAASDTTLRNLGSAAKLLINAVSRSGAGAQKISVRDRFALVLAPKLKSSGTPQSPTDNLITAVTNVLREFGGQIVPDRYEV